MNNKGNKYILIECLSLLDICLLKPKDANGNLLNESSWTYTYYVRDASGNVMGIYTKKFEELATNVYKEELLLQEHSIYGSSRLGIHSPSNNLLSNRTITASVNSNNKKLNVTGESNNLVSMFSLESFGNYKGEKSYELSNHLGNVLAVVSDRLLAESQNGDVVDLYTAQIQSASDYYPFGMQMPGRTMSSESYRYGFNGKEKDDEWKGSGASYDFGARIYDSRLGRWLAIDPLVSKYPFLSPYNFVANNPLIFVDPDGKKIKAVNSGAKDAINVLYEKYYAFLAIKLSDDGVYSSRNSWLKMGDMKDHINEYNSFAKEENKKNKKYNKEHKNDEGFKQKPMLPLLTEDDVEEASKFLTILLKQEIIEVEVTHTESTSGFVNGRDGENIDGSEVKGSGIVTNNGQYAKFIDALKKVGKLNKPIADALFKGETTTIGYVDKADYNKENINIMADAGQNGDYAYFKNYSDKRPSERNYTEGLLVVDGTNKSDAQNSQIILDAAIQR